MFNIVALKYSAAQEAKLLEMGFTSRRVFVKRLARQISKGQLIDEQVKLGCLQFQVTRTWLGREENSDFVSVALTWRKESEPLFLKAGFEQIAILGKRGSGGMTVLATPRDEKYILATMSDPPDQWYVDAWWAPSSE